MSFEPTYKELKRSLIASSVDKCPRFEPTYKELKQFSKTYSSSASVKVLSLPIRN